MPIQIDFTGSDAGGNFDPLDAGTYKATIEKIEQGVSQAGNPKLEFTFNLTEHNGRKQWRNYALTPKALWALKGDLVNLGIDVPEGEFEFEPEELIGMPVLLELKQKPHWKDADRMDNEIAKVVKDDGSFNW
jgi:hypothetical protein